MDNAENIEKSENASLNPVEDLNSSLEEEFNNHNINYSQRGQCSVIYDRIVTDLAMGNGQLSAATNKLLRSFLGDFPSQNFGGPFEQLNQTLGAYGVCLQIKDHAKLKYGEKASDRKTELKEGESPVDLVPTKTVGSFAEKNKSNCSKSRKAR